MGALRPVAHPVDRDDVRAPRLLPPAGTTQQLRLGRGELVSRGQPGVVVQASEQRQPRVRPVRLGDGATLIREGERGREFIVIAEGTVKVTRNGKELRELGAGEFIGEIALVADVPRTATVTATSPVRLLVVTDRAFRGLLEQMPSIAKKVLQSLGERLHSDAV